MSDSNKNNNKFVCATYNGKKIVSKTEKNKLQYKFLEQISHAHDV